jgi:hypothetical protein
MAGLTTHDELHRLSGKLSGVISERDYITKIALLGKTVSKMPLQANSSCVRSHHRAVLVTRACNMHCSKVKNNQGKGDFDKG